MKHSFFLGFILTAVLAVLGSCVSIDLPESSSWARGSEEPRGTIRIISVSAEKSGEWGALEKEISDLLPLLFSEKSYLVLSASPQADYAAEVKIREREYADGWQIKRSLSAEIRLWADDGSFQQLPPLSAGRALNQGKKSFASSKTLSVMLRRAIGHAVYRLPGEEEEE